MFVGVTRWLGEDDVSVSVDPQNDLARENTALVTRFATRLASATADNSGRDVSVVALYASMGPLPTVIKRAVAACVPNDDDADD
jgi:hypothetical protein